jgi:3-methyladenine DNA glycosylase AlkD
MSRSILLPFDEYQKERVKFVQKIAELAQRPQNIETLQKAGVMALLRPLLLDNVPSIQQTAALALGRLASYSDELASEIVSYDILPQLVFSLSEQNRFYKKAAAFVLRAVAKHSPVLAQAVVDSGALDSLVACLEEFDPTVKENAAWALSYIAKHNAELANAVIEAGAVPLLVLCVQEPEINLKKIAASALAEICKHNSEMAQKLVDQRAVPFLTNLLIHKDFQLKRQICACLAQISKHRQELAEEVVNNNIFPKIFALLKDSDSLVRKNAASCIREIAKHSSDLANTICNTGGSAALVEYISETKGKSSLPGIMTLGYIASFDEHNAMAIINSKGIEPLRDVLVEENDDHMKSAAAWTLGQLGGHSYNHAKAMAEADALSHLLAVYKCNSSSEDLKKKAKKSLKNILVMCTVLDALEPLIKEAPEEILIYVLNQFKKILPTDPSAKKAFVLSGGLKVIQGKRNSENSKLQLVIEDINLNYPNEIIQYYSPNYAETLIHKLEEYNPDR